MYEPTPRYIFYVLGCATFMIPVVLFTKSQLLKSQILLYRKNQSWINHEVFELFRALVGWRSLRIAFCFQFDEFFL